MNQTFQFRRFALLVRLYFEENGKWYLTKLAIFFIVCSAFLPVFAANIIGDTWFVFFLIILVVINVFDSTTGLSNYSKKDGKGMRFLLLPASDSEKVVACLFINILFCLVNIFLLLVIISIMAYFSLELSKYNEGGLGYVGNVLTYFLIVSVFVFSSVYFVKHYIIKLILSIYVLFQLNYYFDKIFFNLIPNKPVYLRYTWFYSWTVAYDRNSDVSLDFFQESRVDHVYLIDSHPNLIPLAGMLILLSAIWYASFLRLKEVEI